MAAWGKCIGVYSSFRVDRGRRILSRFSRLEKITILTNAGFLEFGTARPSKCRPQLHHSSVIVPVSLRYDLPPFPRIIWPGLANEDV